jgi:hypothetical protein
MIRRRKLKKKLCSPLPTQKQKIKILQRCQSNESGLLQRILIEVENITPSGKSIENSKI